MAPLVATPPTNATGAPKSAPSILNCTGPVGVPAPGATALTVAVNVTGWPNNDGFTDEFTAAVVSALFTSWVIDADVLPLKFPSPPYTAVIVCEPTTKLETFAVATPEPFNAPLPIVM